MARVYNFSAGPAVLPEEVLQEAADEMLDYRGTGMSVMEMSHRSKAYDTIIKEAEADLRELMNIPDNYKVLFLQGGASQQFAMIPMNLMKNRVADYIVTGQWAKKAYQEASLYGKANKIASSEDKTFSYIPDCSDLDIDDDVDYVYICENNTIYGTKYHTLPNTKGHTLVADVSSCFLSEPVDVEKYGVIYGGVQKNVGPAGVVIAIVREDLIPEEVDSTVPTMLAWKTQADAGSLYNTPPCYGIYICGKVFKWIKKMGGLDAMKKHNEEKAKILYDFLDNSKLFKGTVVKEAESGKVITDLSGENRRFVLLQGGKGGNGNHHYATSTMQAPKYAQPGQPAKEMELLLELKVIADVGLVGFPNVGKSTFLTKVSNARPKIANYHFTTLNPHLGVVDLEGAKGFVIADIPGLIEGASEGVGLGFEFLRHIERTKVMIHIVDVASTEGRDPIADIYAINKELENYNPEIAKRPQVIAANKTDMIFIQEGEEDPVERLRKEFEPKGIKVYPISALSGEGIRELLYEVRHMLDGIDEKPIVFEQEFFPEYMLADSDEPYSVTYDEESDEYVVEGPRIEKMLGYTNLESEKGFTFFQNFLKLNGILEQLEELGIQEGDTVRMYGLSFDYYK